MDIVLIPGLWLDGTSWDEVVPELRQAGHRTHALTLPGMESQDAERSEITLRDHVNAVVATIDSVEPTNGGVVLVGHSGGGAIAHAAVDMRPDRVARVVYVDSIPLGDGGVINDAFRAKNGDVPLPDWSLFDEEDLIDLDEQQRARFRERAIPAPVHVASDPQQLIDERRYEVPITVISCEFPSAMLQEMIEQGHGYVRELAGVRDVEYIDLPTGHWPQFTRPKELSQAIIASLGSSCLNNAVKQPGRAARIGLWLLPAYGFLLGLSTLTHQPPVADFDAYARYVTTDVFLVSHLGASILGAALAVLGVVAVTAYLVAGRAAGLAVAGLVLTTVANIYLSAAFGSATFVQPGIGRAHLAGVEGMPALNADTAYGAALTATAAGATLLLIASAIVVGIAIARTHHRLRAVGVAYAMLLPLFAVSGFLLPIVQSAAGFAVAVAAALLAVQLPRTAELAAPFASRATE